MPLADLCSNVAVVDVDFVCAVVQQGLYAAFVAGRGAYEFALAFGESCGCKTDACGSAADEEVVRFLELEGCVEGAPGRLHELR